MTAENDSYTGMDLTADGYDPNGEPLTPVIVQAPQYGSLTYDTTTGLYDYTAPTGFTGEDCFQYELSNGNAVSNVVTVQILAYNGIIPLGTYDSFPGMDKTDPFDGPPSQASIKQGGDIGDCWFVAAAAGLAETNPGEIEDMISYNATYDTYRVKFPNQKPVLIEGFEHDPNGYSISNGNWLSVLEKAYGQMIYNQKWATWGNKPYDYINRADSDNTGIEALTGNSTDTDSFWCTRDSTTSTKILNALNNSKVIVAGTSIAHMSAPELQAMGLVPDHTYTVVGYDSGDNEVRLRNSWGGNPEFNDGSGLTYLGQNDPGNVGANGKPLPAPGNGYFWMSLSEFTKAFDDIAYEE